MCNKNAVINFIGQKGKDETRDIKTLHPSNHTGAQARGRSS